MGAAATILVSQGQRRPADVQAPRARLNGCADEEVDHRNRAANRRGRCSGATHRLGPRCTDHRWGSEVQKRASAEYHRRNHDAGRSRNGGNIGEPTPLVAAQHCLTVRPFLLPIPLSRRAIVRGCRGKFAHGPLACSTADRWGASNEAQTHILPTS